MRRGHPPHLDSSVVAELLAEDNDSWLTDIGLMQPAIFAVQVAQAALWRSWGVEPEAVVGHSMGEVAAAYVAGALSLGDAARVICARARLLRRPSCRGAMVVAELTLAEAQDLIAGHEPSRDRRGQQPPIDGAVGRSRCWRTSCRCWSSARASVAGSRSMSPPTARRWMRCARI